MLLTGTQYFILSLGHNFIMMSKYMQVVWLYIIGLLIIFIGIFTLMSSPGPASFVIMLVGLAIAALGAAHGRRMRMMGQFDIEQIMRGKGLVPDEREKPKRRESRQAEEVEPVEGGGQAAAPAMSAKFRELMTSFKRKPQQEQMSSEDIEQQEMSDIKEGKIVPAEAD